MKTLFHKFLIFINIHHWNEWEDVTPDCWKEEEGFRYTHSFSRMCMDCKESQFKYEHRI